MPVHTLEEVAKHNQENDCWVILNDSVYDVTEFMHVHPGLSASAPTHSSRDAVWRREVGGLPKVMGRVNATPEC